MVVLVKREQLVDRTRARIHVRASWRACRRVLAHQVSWALSQLLRVLTISFPLH